MFKKLLNVGKGHSNEKLLQQQQQQQQRNLFQLNEIRSYGFSHLCCLGYSPSLSLLAAGSKYGLLRVLGNSSVEFSHQLEPQNSIRQIEFIDCRDQSVAQTNRQPVLTTTENELTSSQASTRDFTLSAKVVVLTDNGQLHLFELKTFKQQIFADNTTQTDGQTSDCCGQAKSQATARDQAQHQNAPEYTRLELASQLDFFKFKIDDEDRSRKVTTFEVSSDGQILFVGTEGGNLYQVPLAKFDKLETQEQQVQQQQSAAIETSDERQQITNTVTNQGAGNDDSKEDETTVVNLNDEPQIEEIEEPFEMIKFEEHVSAQLGDEIKSKKQGAIESIKRHPASVGKLLISYHRGLSVIYEVQSKLVDKYFFHNQVLECSCFADQNGDFFYTSHNDGSYIKWDTRRGSQAKANEDFLGQLYGPYPCKPTPKIQACTGLVNDQLEDLVIFSGGMPRATYDDKNPVTIVRAGPDGKDSIKIVLDFTSKVLDFVVITRPRGNTGAGAKTSGGGKKGKHKQQQQQQQQQRSNQIAVALAILAEEEFVVIDLLNSESYLEFALPYLNCVHSSAITCNQHYSDISDELYEQLLAYNKQQLKGKLSSNDWPVTGGKVIDAPEVKSHDILLTGHEDGSVNFWDVSDLSMRHLLHLSTARFFSTNEDDLVQIDGLQGDNKQSTNVDQDTSIVGAAQTTAASTIATSTTSNENNSDQQDNSSAWPPLKRVGRFDPFSDDTRLAIRRLSLCPQVGTLVVAGTGGKCVGWSAATSLLLYVCLPLRNFASLSAFRLHGQFCWRSNRPFYRALGHPFISASTGRSI